MTLALPLLCPWTPWGPHQSTAMKKTPQTIRRATCEEMANTCTALIDVCGSLPLAETIRIILAAFPDANRGMAADGLTLAINRLAVRTIRMQNGEWAIARKVTS